MAFYLVLTIEENIGLCNLVPRVRIIPEESYTELRTHLDRRDGFYEMGPVSAADEKNLCGRLRDSCRVLDISSTEVIRMQDYDFHGRQHIFRETHDVGVIKRAIDSI